MKRTVAIVLIFFFAVPLLAQQKPTTTQNPLDKLRDQAKALFETAGFPFSEEQEKSIALMIEDRRQASEDLFGQLMDFRSGPVQGQQQDRAVAAIKWMHDEFRKRLREYLTEEQLPIWTKYEAGDGVRALEDLIKELTGGAPPKQETQFMRIINNSFTAEQSYFNGQSVNTDVIQRAGIGAFHGNFAFQFKDEALNARNPFAHNKPPYQERRTNVNFSGPVIPNKVTINVNANHNVRENVGTVHAITQDGPFDLGIVNPWIGRYVGGSATYQISNAHSFVVGTNFENNAWKNQDVGGFNLPERAYNGTEDFHNIYLTQIAVLSDKTLYRTNANFWTDRQNNRPVSTGVTIDVLSSFGSGGAPYSNEGERHGYYLNNLFAHNGQKISVKGGFDGGYRKSRSVTEDNFLGTFTFSDLDSFRRGIATTYRVRRGDPLLTNSQFEMSVFAENDIKLTRRLTAMFGVRYDRQSNLADHNNAAPRLGFAYAAGASTVIRGGAGIYYDRMWDWVAENVKRADGTRQYEIVINDALYPNPFINSNGTINPPTSIRVMDPNLVAPYSVISSVSVERTFKNTLFLSGRYEFRKGVHLFRTRDLNAPLLGLTRPDPSRGSVLNLESTASSRSQILTFNVRQRFSIFNANASYSYYAQYNDSDGFFSTAADNYNLRLDWGRSTTPIHQINGTVNAKLFLGVFLTGSVNANSGNLYNITTGDDDNHDSNINDRPPNTGRNSADGPRFVTFNFNISKAFFLRSSANGSAGASGPNVNLFANMNNAFNRTNYGTPSGVMSSEFFGKPYSARNAREVEVGLRFQF
jgi:hypothetical protein